MQCIYQTNNQKLNQKELKIETQSSCDINK